MKRILLFLVCMLTQLSAAFTWDWPSSDEELFARDAYQDFVRVINVSKNYYEANEDAGVWCPVQLLDVLKSKNRETVKKYQPRIEKTGYDYGDEFLPWYDAHAFDFMALYVNGNNLQMLSLYRYKIIDLTFGDTYMATVRMSDTLKSFMQAVRENPKGRANINVIDASPLKNAKPIVLDGDWFYLIFDFAGQYLDVYVNERSESSHLATYCYLDKRSFHELRNLIVNNTCDLSRVTWPKRDLGFTENRVRFASDSLRLRSGGSIRESSIKTLAKGTRVTIVETGRVDYIDDMVNYWTKVRLDDGSEGWCFGGYLNQKP